MGFVDDDKLAVTIVARDTPRISLVNINTQIVA